MRHIDEVGTVAALFVGQLYEVAARAFEVVQGKFVTCDVVELSAAIADAAFAVDEFFASLNADERLEYEWGGTARGVVLFMSPAITKLVWLGDVQVFHARQAKFVNTLKTHTLFHELQAAGHANIDTRYHGILLKHLSRRHESDSAEWELERGDAVVVCSPHIESAIVEQCLQETGLNGLARSIVDAAQAKESRIDHTALVLTVGE